MRDEGFFLTVGGWGERFHHYPSLRSSYVVSKSDDRVVLIGPFDLFVVRMCKKKVSAYGVICLIGAKNTRYFRTRRVRCYGSSISAQRVP